MQETADELLVRQGEASPVEGAALGLVVSGPHSMRAVQLDVGSELVIGRDASCGLSLPEPALSRQHARFVGHVAGVFVEDLGSRHGTWLGGKRIDSALLGVGALVRLADVIVTISFGAYLQDYPYQSGVHEVQPARRKTQTAHEVQGSPERREPQGQTLRARIASLEYAEARRALAQTGGNQRRAAELLGMPLRTLERRLRAWRAQETSARGSGDANEPGSG